MIDSNKFFSNFEYANLLSDMGYKKSNSKKRINPPLKTAKKQPSSPKINPPKSDQKKAARKK